MSFKTNIADAEIISESLNDSGFLNFIAEQAERLTRKNRGSWVTETLILSDMAKDRSALRDAYRINKESVDAYFGQVDVEKVVHSIAPDAIERIKYSLSERAKNNIPGLVVGGVTGAALAAIIIQKRKK
ncbi:MAG: hypothetical protein WEA79_11145 [Balneolaceae bacterium]